MPGVEDGFANGCVSLLREKHRLEAEVAEEATGCAFW